jgi:hypothetical protein
VNTIIDILATTKQDKWPSSSLNSRTTTLHLLRPLTPYNVYTVTSSIPREWMIAYTLKSAITGHQAGVNEQTRAIMAV